MYFSSLGNPYALSISKACLTVMHHSKSIKISILLKSTAANMLFLGENYTGTMPVGINFDK
jgi:hypothetical protein